MTIQNIVNTKPPENASVREINRLDTLDAQIVTLVQEQITIIEGCEGRARGEEPALNDDELPTDPIDSDLPAVTFVTRKELTAEVDRLHEDAASVTRAISGAANRNLELTNEKILRVTKSQDDYAQRFETLRGHVGDLGIRVNSATTRIERMECALSGFDWKMATAILNRLDALESAAGTKPEADLSCRADEHQEGNEARSGGPDAESDDEDYDGPTDDDDPNGLWLVQNRIDGAAIVTTEIGELKQLPLFTHPDLAQEFIDNLDDDPRPYKVCHIDTINIGRMVVAAHEGDADFFTIDHTSPVVTSASELLSTAELIAKLLRAAFESGDSPGNWTLDPIVSQESSNETQRRKAVAK